MVILVKVRPNPDDPHSISLVMVVFELYSTFMSYQELRGPMRAFGDYFVRVPEGRFWWIL